MRRRAAIGTALALALVAGSACRRIAPPPPATPAVDTTPTPAPPAGPTQTVALLGGSVRVEVPEGAEVSAAPHSIMGAATPAEEETRVVLEPGPDLARFVMLAREGFVRGTGDARPDAVAFLGGDAQYLQVRALPFSSGYEGALIVSGDDGPRHDGPHYVLGAVFERDDHTMFEIFFLILPEMLGEVETYRERALQILASAKPGEAALPVATEHRFDDGVGGTVEVTLPHPAVLTRKEGPDFLVFRAQELRGLGEHPGVFGIYFGGHPSFQYNQGEPARTADKRPGTLLGQPTDWYVWTMSPGHEMAEAIVERRAHDFVHVFVHGPPEAIEGLQHAAEAMTITEAAPTEP